MKRSLAISIAFACLIVFSTMTHAQQPGPNVDVLPAFPNGNASPPFPPPPISLTDATRGDGYLQRQVEPTVATSTYNPDHILAAFGDYRTTSIPNDTGLPGTAASGWIGLSRSYDRGQTWYGSLVPCFPQDPSTVCASSPLSGLQTGSDPTLATTPGGHFYLGALFFTSGHISNVAVVHYRDVPDTDGGDTIRYQGAVIVDKGSQSDSGNFIDKPAIAADIARGTSSASVCGPVYIAYTIFTGGGDSVPFTSKVGFSRSKQGKCGSGWDSPQFLNKTYKQNQGTAIGIDPNTGKIYVVWRHVFQPGGDGFPDAIMVATSTDGGATFSNPVQITSTNFASFDQPGLDTNTFPNNPTFRSNSFPSIAVDGNGAVYVADQERVSFTSGHPAGYYEPRIVIRSSNNGGSKWTTGSIVDPGSGSAQQFMPALSFAGGLLKVMWYDFREQNQASDNVAGGWFVTGFDRQMKTYVAQSNLSAVDNLGNPVFSQSVPVTQYLIEVNTGKLPTVGDIAGGDPAVNRPNLPMYSGGTTPFTGDYIGIMTASPFVPNPGGATAFRWATQPTDYIAMPSFGVWTDARDVVFPTFNFGRPTLTDMVGWKQYAPPGTGSSCINAGSRNANVYLSEIKPGVIAGSPATSRQLVDVQKNPIERAFPIYVQNPNSAHGFFRLSFDQNSKVAGSFVQGTETTVAATTFVDVEILPFSTVTTTLYVFCSSCGSSLPFAPFSVSVHQYTDSSFTQVQQGGATTTVFFDSDPTAPFVTNAMLGTNENHDANVSNPQYANPQYANPQYANPQYANPQYANPQYANPQYANIAPSDSLTTGTLPVGDFVWTVTDVGNNASGYTGVTNVTSTLGGKYTFETIISRTYNFPGVSAGSCNSQPIPQDSIISLIPNPQYANPQYANPQYANPQYANATFAAVPPPPGSTGTATALISSATTSTSGGDGTTKMPVATDHVYVILRVYRTDSTTTLLTSAEQTDIIANTTLLVFPQAPNTGQGTPAPQPPPPASSNKTFTTTALASSPNPSFYGQNVTFTAPVTAFNAATPGTVDFRDGGTVIAAAVPLTNSQAMFATSSLSVGPHNITANYSGDPTSTGSVSRSVPQTVTMATTTTTLASRPNPSVSGNLANFFATVMVNAPGAGTPTGMVVFTDTSTNQMLGTAPLLATEGGFVATVRQTLMLVGTHTIRAAYGGDNNFSGSSGNLTQTVAAPLVITTTSLPAAVRNSSYSTILTATGGLGTYSWSSTGSPASLSMDTGGTFSGTPGVADVTTGVTVTFTVSDSGSGQIVQKALVLPIFPTWINAASFQDPRTNSGIEGAAASLIQGELYVSHGYRFGDSPYLSALDLNSGTWTHGGKSLPDANISRSELAGATDGFKHYAIGGRGANTLTNVEVFDPTIPSWTELAPLHTGRGGLAAVYLNGKIYAIGGRDGDTYGNGTILNVVEVYDPTNDLAGWSDVAPLPVAASDIYATVAFKGKIYVFGGATAPNTAIDMVQIYDPTIGPMGTWSMGSPMPTARGAAMAAVIGNRIAVFGGFDPSAGNLAVTEVYDPAADSWSPGPALLSPASEIAAGLVTDGVHVLAVGSGIFGVSRMVVQELDFTPPPPAVLLIDQFNTAGVTQQASGPPTPTTITLTATQTQVTQLATYHFNNGNGATPGTISLKDQNGNVYGPFPAQGVNAQSQMQPPPFVAWVATLNNVTLPAGIYTVIDSDPSTWSFNADSNNAGFVRVWGSVITP